MNLKQRKGILSTLYDDRNDLFFHDFKNMRESEQRPEVRAATSRIEAFKELTKHLLDDFPVETMQKYDRDDHVFTTEEWMAEGCRGMSFIPSDGCGYWGTAEGYYYGYSDVFGHKPEWATRVLWCNK